MLNPPASHQERAAELGDIAQRIENITEELDNCSRAAGSAWALKLAEHLESARRWAMKAHAEALRGQRYHTRKATARTEGQTS